MLKKKKAVIVPQGDDYADDPLVYKTRREMTLEQQRRHFVVRAARGGDPKNSMPREFDPWFLESQRKIDLEEGMTYAQIFRRRLCLFIIFIFSHPIYDYIYIIGLLAFVAMVPLTQCDINFECGRDFLTESGNDPIVERDLVEKVLLGMVVSAIVPILSSALIRIFMVDFLKENSTEKSRRFYGLFFFLTLKVLYFKPGFKKLLPKAIADRIPDMPKFKLRNKDEAAASASSAGEEGVEGGEGDGAGQENDIEKNNDNDSVGKETEGSTDNDEQGEGGIGKEGDEDEEESDASSIISDDDEEFEVAENEVVWTCRVCLSFNMQEKVKEAKSLKSRRLGTKENAENIKILVKTKGRVHEHYVVEFNHLKHANQCWKCRTPFDYKPRKCAQEFFNPIEDFGDQLHEAKHAAAGDAEEDKEGVKPVKSKKRLRGRDSIIAFEHQSFAAALTTAQLGPLDKLKVIGNKVKNSYNRFMDPEPAHNQVLYNDHTFKTRLREFMPFVERRKLKKGERYQIGDEIEAIERRVIWYPGVIKRAGTNGTYDIIYDNGDLVETVLPIKIRFKQKYKLGRLPRFQLCWLLILTVVTPYSITTLYANDDMPSPENKLHETYAQIIYPFVAALMIIMLATILQWWSTFVWTAQAGLGSHLNLLLYLLLPHIFGVAFFYIAFEKVTTCDRTSPFFPGETCDSYGYTEEEDRATFMWYQASIAQLGWSLLTSSQMKQINFFMGTACYVLTIFLTAFGVVMGLHLDSILEVENYLLIYIPLLIMILMILGIRLAIPYVRSSKF